MKDQFNRQIHYMRLSITDRCNLRCSYCMPVEGIHKKHHSDILTLEEYLPIVRAAAALGVNKVRLTGGEPLVRKNVTGLIRDIKAIEGINTIAMTTNGQLLKPYASELRNAGLDRLNISIDSLKPDRYREMTRGGSLEEVLKGIDEAFKVGFSLIKLNVVLIGGFNTEEIKDFIDFANEKVEVRFIELMPIGEASSWAKERFVSAQDMILDHNLKLPLVEAVTDGPARLLGLNAQNGKVSMINPISDHFCHACNRIRITADGKLKSCLHSNAEIALKPYLEDDERLLQVMKEAVFLKPRAHDMNNKDFKPIDRDMYTIGG